MAGRRRGGGGNMDGPDVLKEGQYKALLPACIPGASLYVMRRVLPQPLLYLQLTFQPLHMQAIDRFTLV